MTPKPTPRLRRLLSRARAEDGTVSIEAAMWIPFFFILMTMVADVALIMHGQARILRIVQDENRQWAAGIYPDFETVEAGITQRLSAEGLTDDPQLVQTRSNGFGIIESTVAVRSADLDAVGFFEAFTSLAMVVRSQQIMEN